MENQQTQVASRQIVKKITSKIVMGGKVDLEKLFEYGKAHGKDAVMPLYGVIGIASGYTPGQTDLGPFVKLIGQFKAVNTATGDEFRSGAAILPGAASDLIYGTLKGLEASGGAVEFALRVGVKRDDSSPVSYVFVIEQLYQPQAQDALGNLERSLGGGNVQQIADKTGDQKGQESAESAQADSKASGTRRR